MEASNARAKLEKLLVANSIIVQSIMAQTAQIKLPLGDCGIQFRAECLKVWAQSQLYKYSSMIQRRMKNLLVIDASFRWCLGCKGRKTIEYLYKLLDGRNNSIRIFVVIVVTIAAANTVSLSFYLSRESVIGDLDKKVFLGVVCFAADASKLRMYYYCQIVYYSLQKERRRRKRRRKTCLFSSKQKVKRLVTQVSMMRCCVTQMKKVKLDKIKIRARSMIVLDSEHFIVL